MRTREMMMQGLRRLASAGCLGLLLSFAPMTGLQAQGTATLMADQVYVDAAGRLVASGAVEVWHGSTRLTANRVIYDQRNDQLSIEGPIVLNDGPDQIGRASCRERVSDPV